ncbi:pentapeptide repeat-containing protein [Pseudomonas sp. B21-031]|uniref:pentapeptide repeat-containing protein n=1 Tax=Pseudomonas sp. B21-031 TaxID=2895482 RepID=UPI00215F42A5|nr:pentapeptide repeat-containing protein [Pseudomonas sp. B21-031]UVL67551.1 pentapeptide repeat-containing protein [Pseudomonas sp. B21-031]
MQIDTFKSIIKTFADPGEEILYDKQRIMFSINGNLIDAIIVSDSGDIYIEESGLRLPASRWIVQRLANLPLLCNRILEQIQEHKNFVSPAADFLPSLESQPDEATTKVDDALRATLNALNERSPFETNVLYITSDAGEGKTSLINRAAREQARNFSSGKSDWLLVPIMLGGRHFLRFDDITVGALQNKYRFPFLYYNSFLALVRMGVIVPAFDGFEEMFVENSSGEALSAMGILVGALNSTGSVVVAARKAYFEFENLKSQEKLYDTISSYSVGFSKLEINRWSKKQFLQYCENRSIRNSENIYEKVSERLGEDHSLITRPVLVRRLVDIAEAHPLEEFLDKIHSSGSDFFSVFVKSIIEREAMEKWIDRSGDIGSNLLTVEEHCELLSLIAVSMWEARTDYLKQDHLDMVAEYFCESKKKSSLQFQQIRDRIKGHALLVSSPDNNRSVEFDHDEFRQFFLGDGLGSIMSPDNKTSVSETLNILRRGILPEHTQIALVRSITRQGAESRLSAAALLSRISKMDGQASYTRENCGNLISRLLSGILANELLLEEISFGIDCLRDCKLHNIRFKDCYFAPGSYENTKLFECSFENCNFGKIVIHDTTEFDGVHFKNCSFDSLRLEQAGVEVWEPSQIEIQLIKAGCKFEHESDQTADEKTLTLDENLGLVEKLLRYFMRSTHISESVIKIKLGDRGQYFIDYVLPDLIHSEILEEIDNRGSGNQRRFRLNKPLQTLSMHLASAQGSYDSFLTRFT